MATYTENQINEMTPEELETDFVRAAKMLVGKIDGSQKKLLMHYFSIIGQKNETKDIPTVMRIILKDFIKTRDEKFGLQLYLNVETQKLFS